jgi:hypothetical protein
MTALATTKATHAEAIEKALMTGDLSALSPEQRLSYYKQTCESLGLNPLTKPFEYIKLNNKLTLYARKDATDQLRKINAVSIEKPEIQQIDSLIIVTISARCADGRVDSDIGVVPKTDMGGNLSNALMKAVTKAKRRVTLSICGLGMLDETEVETIPNAQVVPVDEPKQEVRQAGPRVVGSLAEKPAESFMDAVLDATAPTPEQREAIEAEEPKSVDPQMADLVAACVDKINELTNGEARKVQEIMNGRVLKAMDLKQLQLFYAELEKKAA